MFCTRNCDGHLRSSAAPPSFKHLLNLQIASVSLPSRPIPRGGICTEKAAHYGVPEGHPIMVPTMVQMRQTLKKTRKNSQKCTKYHKLQGKLQKVQKKLKNCRESSKKGKQLRKCMEKLQKVQNNAKSAKKKNARARRRARAPGKSPPPQSCTNL